jgi:hypothetical protein
MGTSKFLQPDHKFEAPLYSQGPLLEGGHPFPVLPEES